MFTSNGCELFTTNESEMFTSIEVGIITTNESGMFTSNAVRSARVWSSLDKLGINFSSNLPLNVNFF